MNDSVPINGNPHRTKGELWYTLRRRHTADASNRLHITGCVDFTKAIILSENQLACRQKIEIDIRPDDDSGMCRAAFIQPSGTTACDRHEPSAVIHFP